MITRKLPPHAGSERKEHLKQYILACVHDSVLSWTDLRSLSAIDKVLKNLSRDIKEVLVDLGETGVRSIGASLLNLAADVVAARTRR